MEEPRGEPQLSVCVPLHAFNLPVTDGEGKEENPIRNSIKNRFIKNTGAEMRGERTDMIILFVYPSVVVTFNNELKGNHALTSIKIP